MNPRAVRVTTVISVLLVGLVAAVISYYHIYELADRSGEAWRANLLPLSVDGMLVAATLAIVDKRSRLVAAGWVPWLGLTLGILASLAGNVAAAHPDAVSRIVAAWPPMALAVSIETLVVVLRPAPEPPPEPELSLEERAAELIAQGAGRGTLQNALTITEHKARQFLALYGSNGDAP